MSCTGLPPEAGTLPPQFIVNSYTRRLGRAGVSRCPHYFLTQLPRMNTFFRAFGLLCVTAFVAPAALAQKAPQISAPAAGAVSAATAAQLIKQPNVVVLDVRTPAEFATGHLQGAKNLDFRGADFAQQVAQLDTSKTYMIYCASGNRSGQASRLMKEKGLPKIVDAGALKNLQAGGLKVE